MFNSLNRKASVSQSRQILARKSDPDTLSSLKILADFFVP